MKKITITLSVVMLSCLFSITTVSAQFSQEAKIVSENRESRAEYGTSVAILDTYAVVGTSRENIASGAAYVYHKDAAGDWSFQQSFTAPDPNMGAEYGGGAKLTDNLMVIAAGRANVSGLDRTGALYVYQLNGSTWEYDTKLIASDFSAEAKMGMNPTSLDMQGNTIVAGAPGENLWTGSVYVFEKSGGTWNEVQKIMSPNPQQNDIFGIGVAIAGDYMVVGASEEDNTKGAAHIYKKNSSGVWEHVQRIIASDAMAQGYFGTSVSISNTSIAVGAYGHAGGEGATYIFEDDGTGNWTETQKITASSPSSEANFGWNCLIQNNHLVVSAPHPYGSEKGEVYVYEKTGGLFAEIQKVESNDLAPEDFYGWNIEMDSNQLIVGAPWEDEDAAGGDTVDRAGSAYIFQNPLLSVGDFQDNASVSVYPNPTSKFITISSSSVITKLTLVNQLGAVLLENNAINTNTQSLDLSQYADGIYFLSIGMDNGQTMVKKIMVE
jgi:hypothetical protein